MDQEIMNLPNILIHARGKMTIKEIAFWECLQAALKELGYNLWLIGHHHPQRKTTVPLLRVPNGLDNVAPALEGRGWSSNQRKPMALNEEFLLERERCWRGAELDLAHRERRRNAVQFYHGFYACALDIVKPHLAVIWNGHHPQEMILDQLCRAADCPVAYLERGPFPGTLHFDNTGVLGGSSVAHLSTWEWSSLEERVFWHKAMNEIVNGCRTKADTWWEQPQAIGAARLRKKFNIPSDKKIVLFAGQVDADIQNILFSPNFSSNLSAFDWLCIRLQDFPDVFILGKHHPKSKVPVSKYEKLVAGKGIWTANASLSDCLAVSDRVAAVNSTVLFEALLAGKPVLSMGLGLLSHKDIAYEVTDPEDSVDALRHWLAKQAYSDREKRFFDFGAYLLRRELFCMNGSGSLFSSGRGADKFAASLAAAAAEGQPVFAREGADYFGTYMLESSSLYEFDRREMKRFRAMRKAWKTFQASPGQAFKGWLLKKAIARGPGENA